MLPVDVSHTKTTAQGQRLVQQNISTCKLTLNSATILDFKAAFGFVDAVGRKKKDKETEQLQVDANQKSQNAALIKSIPT